MAWEKCLKRGMLTNLWTEATELFSQSLKVITLVVDSNNRRPPVCSEELSFKNTKIAETNNKIVSFCFVLRSPVHLPFQDPQCQVKYLSFFRVAEFLRLRLLRVSVSRSIRSCKIGV